MQCLGRTQSLRRCSRLTADWPFCRQHRWQWLAGLLALLSAVSTIVSLWTGIPSLWASDKSSSPKTADQCVAKADKQSSAQYWIDVIYCDTQFANFWDRPPTMLTPNKEPLRRNWSRLNPQRDYSVTTPYLPESIGSGAGPKRNDYNLHRIFEEFPLYSSHFDLIVGQVHNPTLLEETHWSDWVVQLGTVQDPGVLLYARFSKPKGWRPPKNCDLAVVEGMPIAYGTTDQQGGLIKYQVMYVLASDFLCSPKLSR
jgi:hypothetical protein